VTAIGSTTSEPNAATATIATATSRGRIGPRRLMSRNSARANASAHATPVIRITQRVTMVIRNFATGAPGRARSESSM
jgi:hypothetical protein